MKRLILVASLCSPIAACDVSDAIMPGYEQGICDERPENCRSATATNNAITKGQGPIPTQTALRRGDALRVWLEPVRLPNGVLTKAGFVYPQ